jgi:class I fructose-bisphosphate aldolase
MFSHGRLANTGYLSILPVDQGIEHSAGASFAPNPMMFDPEHIVKLAIEGGCSAVASTFGVLGIVARKYAHKIPFLVKINHNELLSYPNTYDQTLFGDVRQCFDMGAAGIGATVYWGAPESRRQLYEVSLAFAEAHRLGMFTVLWCYVRNAAFKTAQGDHSLAADLTGQANHLGVTIQADIIKQKIPEGNGGYNDPATKASMSCVMSPWTPAGTTASSISTASSCRTKPGSSAASRASSSAAARTPTQTVRARCW